MGMDITPIPGCYFLRPRVFSDARGRFVKTFHAPSFEAFGLRTDWREDFFSTSNRGVVRGMHFQQPPAAHAKMVFCLAGEVLDVVLDLRRGSPSFGTALGFSLKAAQAGGLYIPTGCAHGFLSRTAASAMYYKTTSGHSPEHDAGIAWDSFGFDWPGAAPVLSERDRRHPRLADFDSPFEFDPGRAWW